MTAADAALAVERHATSKIARPEDLAAIATLGFRGEALPSIASVSRLRLQTRARDAGDGVEVRVAGGGKAEVAPAGVPPGTVVEVRDLFYNVPARRKFLKSDGAESGHISRAITQLALGFFEIGFTLVSGPRTLIDCAPAASLAERFQQIYGERPELVEVRKEAAGIRLFGFAASLAGEAPANGPQHLFVNRRAVKDKTIAHAIGEAYRRATIKPRRPEAHLFLEVPPERVDVNVHPAKTEVRFLEQSLVHEVVRRALGEALGQEVVPHVPLERPAAPVPEPRAQSIPGVLGGLGAASRWGPVTDLFRRRAPGEDGQDAVREGPPPPAAAAPAAGGDLSAMGTGPLIPLGQCRDTFIVAVDNDGIVIIDQHVAHERILFEQVMRRLTEGPVQAQRLLDPLVITLPPAGREALAAHTGDLARLGFEIEPFGGASVQVAAVPSLLGRAESEAAVRALAEDLEGLERGTGAAAALGADCGHHRLSCRRQGERPPDHGEDVVAPPGAAAYRLFDGLPARPPGAAAVVAAGAREALRKDLAPVAAQLDRGDADAERAVVAGARNVGVAQQADLQVGRRQPAAVQRQRFAPAVADAVIEQDAAAGLDAELLRLAGHQHVDDQHGGRRFRVNRNGEACLPGGPAERAALGVLQPVKAGGRHTQQLDGRVAQQIENDRLASAGIRRREADGPVRALRDREHPEGVGARPQQAGVDDRLPGGVTAKGAERIRPGDRGHHAVERHREQGRWRAVGDGGGAGDMRRHEVAFEVDRAQQLRCVDRHHEARRRRGGVVGGPPSEQIAAAARGRRMQRVALGEQRQLVRDAFHDGAAQIGRSRHAAGRAAGQQRLRATATPGRVQHVGAVGGPRQPDAQRGRHGREDVDGLDAGVHQFPLLLTRSLDEQRHRRDVGE